MGACPPRLFFGRVTRWSIFLLGATPRALTPSETTSQIGTRPAPAPSARRFGFGDPTSYRIVEQLVTAPLEGIARKAL